MIAPSHGSNHGQPRRPGRFRLRRKSPDAIQAILDERLHAQAIRAARHVDLLGVNLDSERSPWADAASAAPAAGAGIESNSIESNSIESDDDSHDASEAGDGADDRADEPDDEAAVTDWLVHAHVQNLAEQAAARAASLGTDDERAAVLAALPGLPAVVRQSAAEWKDSHGRPIPLADLRFIERHYAEAASYDEYAEDPDAGPSEYEEALDASHEHAGGAGGGTGLDRMRAALDQLPDAAEAQPPPAARVTDPATARYDARDEGGTHFAAQDAAAHDDGDGTGL